MPARLPALRLAAGRERSLHLRHPWVFSGAVAHVDGQPQAGDTVEVRAHDGALLALAAYSPQSQIRARVWSFAPVRVDAALLAERVRRAVAWRAAMLDPRHDACRLVHGESDGLPGVIADRYGHHRQ